LISERTHELVDGSHTLERQKVDSLAQSRQTEPQQDPDTQVSTATHALFWQVPSWQALVSTVQSESSLQPATQAPVSLQYSLEAQSASEQHCWQEPSQHRYPSAVQQVSPQTNSGLQHTSPRQVPDWQHAPPHIDSAGQQVSSPMQMVPSGQHALSQQAAGVSQHAGPQTDLPAGQQSPFVVQAPSQQPARVQVAIPAQGSTVGSGGAGVCVGGGGGSEPPGVGVGGPL
jgi:hypothetical protein